VHNHLPRHPPNRASDLRYRIVTGGNKHEVSSFGYGRGLGVGHATRYDSRQPLRRFKATAGHSDNRVASATQAPGEGRADYANTNETYTHPPRHGSSMNLLKPLE
jgi:hypothetical protein